MLAWIGAALRRIMLVMRPARSAPPFPAAPRPDKAGRGTPARPLEVPTGAPTLDAVPAPAPPTLAMPMLVAINGAFPDRGGDGSAAFTQGMVQLFAGGISAFGAPRAEGQMLPVNMNQALFGLLGTTFGGNGQTDFALPNLNGRTPVGGSPVGQMTANMLTLTWMIAAQASPTAPLTGMVALFAAGWAPDGWLVADGGLLPVYQNIPLFEAIGNTFGGSSPSTLALPDLDGAAVVGAGDAPGLPPVALGQRVSGPIPGLGLAYLICTAGVLPPTGGGGFFPQNSPFVGQVIAFAGSQVPDGWALCDGSLIPIENNDVLFAVIGTTYGGDGETNFALPDLRGRMLVGLAG